MRRRKNSKMILGLLIAVVALGVGYAAITGVNLLINGSTSVTANGDFKVRFVKPLSSETAIESPVQNAITISGHNADETLMDVSEMSASVTDDTHATFAVGALDEVGEYVDFTYTVVNESDEGIDAALSFDIADENDLADCFEITKSVGKNKIAPNETTTVTVTVKLIGQPKVNDAEATFKVTLTATPVDETSESGSASGGNEPQSTFGGTLVASKAGETHKGIVYLDPSDLTVECDENSELTTTPTGCKKFYIFDDSNDKYTMIMDRNTTAKVAWNSSGKNADGMNEVAIRLNEDTTGWVGSPRLITANELAHIVGADSNDTIKWAQSKTYGTDDTTNKASWFYLDGSGTTYSSSDGWQKQVANSTTPSNYAWLYNYTIGCESYGCTIADSSTYGYWTSDAVIGYSDYAWGVNTGGRLYHYIGVKLDTYCGVRPVITIDKSILN